jgi:hypothetical protein
LTDLTFRFKNYKRNYLISFLLIVLLSWGRYIVSNSLKVDGIILEGLGGNIISILFFSSVILHFYSFHKIQSEDISFIKYAYIINAMGLLMLPCISNDIYSLLAYGESFDYSSQVFIKNITSANFFYDFISPLYKTTPNMYGIVTLVLAKYSVIPISILLSVFNFKLICFFLVSIVIFLINRIDNISNQSKVFVLLNPLWTIEAIGQSHCEVISVSLFLISIYFINKSQIYLSGLLFGLACFSKVSMVLCFPILLYYFILLRGSSWKTLIIFLIKYFIVIIFLFTICYYQFRDIHFLVRPFLTIDTMRPTGSFVAYIYETLKVLKAYSINQSTEIFKLGFKILAISYILVLVYKLKARIMANGAYLVFGVITAMLLLYSHRFMTWYLILLLPVYFWINNGKSRLLFFCLSSACVIQDCAYYNYISPFSTYILGLSIAIIIIFQIRILILPFDKKN